MAFAHKRTAPSSALTTGSQAQCTSYFIEPVQWMESTLLGVMDGQVRTLFAFYSFIVSSLELRMWLSWQSTCLVCMRPWIPSPASYKPGFPSTREVEARGPVIKVTTGLQWVRDSPDIHETLSQDNTTDVFVFTFNVCITFSLFCTWYVYLWGGLGATHSHESQRSLWKLIFHCSPCESLDQAQVTRLGQRALASCAILLSGQKPKQIVMLTFLKILRIRPF